MHDANWDFWIDHTHLLEKRKENKEKIPKRYYFIFNTHTNDLEYISEAFAVLTGHKSIGNMIDLLAHIHPDDVGYCMECELRVIKFLNQLYYEDNFRFNAQYTYRIKTAWNTYIIIKQNYQALEVDAKGFMSKSIVFHEILPFDYIRDNDDFVIYDRMKNRSVDSNNIYNLTKREWEIYDMIIEGLKTKDICAKIFISEHTLNTHRKHILQKTNCKNFLELKQKLKKVT